MTGGAHGTHRARRRPGALTTVALVCGLLIACAAPRAGRVPGPLDELEWRNRVLLLFAPEPGDPRLAALEAALAARRCDVAERDLLVARVAAARGSLGERALAPAEVRALRQRFDVMRDEALVILVGKDGTEKARGERPRLADLFALIDGMPMRRAEMRERGSACPG